MEVIAKIGLSKNVLVEGAEKLPSKCGRCGHPVKARPVVEVVHFEEGKTYDVTPEFFEENQDAFDPIRVAPANHPPKKKSPQEDGLPENPTSLLRVGRKALDEMAKEQGVKDPEAMSNKGEVIQAIYEAAA
jgi:hypothetical protein